MKFDKFNEFLVSLTIDTLLYGLVFYLICLFIKSRTSQLMKVVHKYINRYILYFYKYFINLIENYRISGETDIINSKNYKNEIGLFYK